MSNISAHPPVLCAISFSVPENPVTTPCGHIFDNLALTNWRNSNNSCPVCRKDLNGIVLEANVALLELIHSWYELQKELRNRNLETTSIPVEDISVDTAHSLSSDTPDVVQCGVWLGES